MSFELPYQFKIDKQIVVLRHRHGGNIRIGLKDTSLHGDGGFGKYAQWKVHLINGGKSAKFESVAHPGKYLRMGRLHRFVDGSGGGGPFTQFNIKVKGNSIMLESNRFGGYYIAVSGMKQIKVGEGGINCHLSVLREGVLPKKPVVVVEQKQAPVKIIKKLAFKPNIFTEPYIFKANTTILLAGPHVGGVLRALTKTALDGNGGEGPFAEFEAILVNGGVTFYNKKVNGYLRIFNQNGLKIDCAGVKGGLFTIFKPIIGNNNTVKLQSNQFKNGFIGMSPDYKIMVGIGGPNCFFTPLRKKIKVVEQKVQPIPPVQPQKSGPFTSKYLFVVGGVTIIMSSPHNHHKTIHVQPMKLGNIGGNGGKGIFAQWKCHKFNNGFAFESCKSGKWLRMTKQGIIDAQGIKGGPLTFFKALKANDGTFRLESVANPGKFIAVKGDGAVFAGLGGKFCHLNIYK
mmetsp:Transcript_17336/g.21323  ORF Transcript_17336/g.21323 Transcript_17336/m.21323 type:complete len:456 (-) Transcript_17336:68-1435(-)